MSTAKRGAILTYTAADGSTEQLWNSRDGVIPGFIGTASGQAWHSGPDSEADEPPEGMRQVTDWVPGAAGRRKARCGWPGEPAVTGGGDG